MKQINTNDCKTNYNELTDFFQFLQDKLYDKKISKIDYESKYINVTFENHSAEQNDLDHIDFWYDEWEGNNESLSMIFSFHGIDFLLVENDDFKKFEMIQDENKSIIKTDDLKIEFHY